MKKRDKGKSHDTVATPHHILSFVSKLFKHEAFWDPCPLKEDYTVNGLTLDWGKHRNIWVNPPYSRVKLWVRKARESFKTCPTIEKIIMLIKNENLGNTYMNNISSEANLFTFCQKITFIGYKNRARFSSILLEFTRDSTGAWRSVQENDLKSK